EDAGHELARVEVESQLDANRPDGRTIVDTEPGRRPKIRQIEIARIREDVARIEKGDGRKSLQKVDAQLRVRHHLSVAALRKPGLRIDGLRRAETIERESAHCRIATGEKALAGRQVLYGLRDRRAGVINGRHGARKPMCKANAFGGGQDDATAKRQPEVLKGLTERLYKPDLGSDRTGCDVAVEREKQATRWIEQIVPRVPNQ